jgi:hypothetical protein
MTTTISEYIPTSDENRQAPGQGSAQINEKGGNTAGQGSDSGPIAPRLRAAVRRTKNLSEGAKVLFDELTDLSFLNSVSPQRGVIEMSKKLLAWELHVSDRTVTRWTRELEAARFIWTRTIWKGGFENTLWHIRGMANPQTELFDRPDPRWGTPRGRRARRPERDGAGRFMKAPNGQICPLDAFTVKPAEKPDLSPAYGQECPRPGDTSVPGQGTKMSPAKGQICPLPTDKNVREPGTPVSAVRGQNCPQPTDSRVPGQGTGLSESKETGAIKDREPGVPKAINRLGNRSGEGEGTGENEFMLLCRDVFGAKEMTKGGPKGEGNGGLWRTLFRQNPDKAWRVIRDVKATKIDRPTEIRKSAAAFAMDLWKRFQ